MKILAIIVSYNFTPWMARCLGSLRTSHCQADVMVLDNASADDTVTRIRQDFPEVTLIENGQNLGFGRANNIGMQYALDHGYEGVLLLNQDAWIDADTLGALAAASSKHPDFGILSPIHLTGSRQRVEQGFADYTGLRSMDCLPKEEVVEADFIDAAIWYMPATALRKVGLFAPLFYHYGEDKDMVNRMHYHGLRIGWMPQYCGCHDREFRQQTRARFLHAERVYHLSEYANIRYSFPKAFAMGVLAVGKKMLKALGKGSWKDFTAYASIAGWLLGKTCAVWHTRRTSIHVHLQNYRS